MHAAVLQMP